MIIVIPNKLSLFTIDKIVNSILENNGKPKDSFVDYNFTGLNFIDSTGVTVFSNLIEYLKMHKVQQKFIGINLNSDAIKFLDDSEFFLRYLGKKLNPHSKPRETTIPLKLVKHQQSYVWIENNCIDWLSTRLKISKKSLVEIKLCLQELFNNIKDHSGWDIGCIFVQHHPNINKIKISLSDFGVGIPSNVRKIDKSISDGEAIIRSMEEGFTTKTSQRNRGVGLHLLASTVIRNNGALSIRSHAGYVFCSQSGIRDFSKEGQFYPGTVLEIELNTLNFDSTLADEEEFSW